MSIECCYQNVGIATSVALTMFNGTDLAEAIGVPFYYGLVEAVILGLYCIGAWKIGWTKAPANVPFWKAIGTSYEIINAEQAENVAVEGDIVMVEKPVIGVTDNNSKTDAATQEVEDSFHYVSHSEAGAGKDVEQGQPTTTTTTTTAANDVETIGTAGVRRYQRLPEKKKEPSFMRL